MNFVLRPPFAHVAGHSWSTTVPPDLFPGSDSEIDPSASCLALSEDGAELGPPHTAHQIIEQDGRGQYSHWKNELRFAASDNSDPNYNGRVYQARWDASLYFERRAQYAIGTIQSWARFLPGGIAHFRGRRVIETGPGRDMGTMLLMAGLGASHIVGVDRFKGSWQTGWHDLFIEKLIQGAGILGADMVIMRQALAAQSLEVGPIVLFSEAFEDVGERLPEHFDISVSNSTFEHFYSFPEAAQALSRCTRPGGAGVHNVDFRDHGNFGDPLQFLMIDDDTYADPAVNDLYGRGNRVRVGEMIEALRRAGFSSVDCHPFDVAQTAYVIQIMEDLLQLGGPRSALRQTDLETLAATLVLQK